MVNTVAGTIPSLLCVDSIHHQNNPHSIEETSEEENIKELFQQEAELLPISGRTGGFKHQIALPAMWVSVAEK